MAHNGVEFAPSSLVAAQRSDEVEETFGADQEELFFGIGDNATRAVGCNVKGLSYGLMTLWWITYFISVFWEFKPK